MPDSIGSPFQEFKDNNFLKEGKATQHLRKRFMANDVN